MAATLNMQPSSDKKLDLTEEAIYFELTTSGSECYRLSIQPHINYRFSKLFYLAIIWSILYSNQDNIFNIKQIQSFLCNGI